MRGTLGLPVGGTLCGSRDFEAPEAHLAELGQQPHGRQLPVFFQQVVCQVQVPQVPQLLQAWGRGEEGGRACERERGGQGHVG